MKHIRAAYRNAEFVNQSRFSPNSCDSTQEPAISQSAYKTRHDISDVVPGKMDDDSYIYLVRYHYSERRRHKTRVCRKFGGCGGSHRACLVGRARRHWRPWLRKL